MNVQNYFSNAEQREQLKRQAAEYAVEFIKPGMIVGLGVGSTAIFAVEGIARRLNDGTLQNISGIPCSLEVEQHAQQLGIPLTTLEDHTIVDVTIDGADEVDPELNLIKGGGGALLREKIVAQASKREMIIVDEEKLSPVLGTRWVVPVEVISFGWGSQAFFLESLGAKVSVRKNDQGDEFITDQGNMILDCSFGPIDNLEVLAEKLTRRVGIVEHGLFLGLASDVIVAGQEGIRHLKREGQ